jgi:hypothetical protein
MSKYMIWSRPTEAPVAEREVPAEKTAADKEAAITNDGAKTPGDDSYDSDAISVNAQAGVQNVEAFAKVWTKRDLILAYVT